MERLFIHLVFLLFLWFSNGRVVVVNERRLDAGSGDGLPLRVRGSPPDAPLSPARVNRMLLSRQASCDAGYGYCPGSLTIYVSVWVEAS
jgi:hypothetical protein